MAGLDGNDRVKGKDGSDLIYGGIGYDTLFGGSQNDELYGYFGNDTLIGDAGNDLLHGGRGRDTFVFYGDDGYDWISDFEPNKDKLRIREGADDFWDLRIIRTRDGVKVLTDDTVIAIDDVTRSEIDAGDFLFW